MCQDRMSGRPFKRKYIARNLDLRPIEVISRLTVGRHRKDRAPVIRKAKKLRIRSPESQSSARLEPLAGQMRRFILPSTLRCGQYGLYQHPSMEKLESAIHIRKLAKHPKAYVRSITFSQAQHPDAAVGHHVSIANSPDDLIR